MLVALRVLGCVLLMAAAGAAHAQGFSHAGVQADAKRYETYLKANWQPGAKQGRELRAEGNRLFAAGADYRAASRAFAQAVVADPTIPKPGSASPAPCSPSGRESSERYELPVNASGAAWNAYERAQNPAAKANALWVLHEAFKRRSFWRPAIDALRTSIALDSTPEAQEALEKLVAQHGFRIAEYKVDTDAAQPRLCIQFSERLAPGTVDWAQYFKVDGSDPQAVNAEARQICLDGFAHGKRYEVQVRAGLPSAIAGETLLKTAELSVYVKDRAASVRATGRGYLLPNRGQQGIPLVTVNTDKVFVEVYRIGDRSIAQALQGGDFQRQISSYDINQPQEPHRRPGLQGRDGGRLAPQRGRDDRLPGRRGDPRTAARRLRAGRQCHQQGTADVDNGRGATQWFIVSDLSITAINGDDGIHGFVRSLATAIPVVNASCPPAGAQQRSAGHGQDRQPRLRALRRRPQARRGRQAPAVLVADTPAGDYAFLDMAICRLRSHRPRRRRPHRARPHRRLRLYRPRRLSPRRGCAPDHAGAHAHGRSRLACP